MRPRSLRAAFLGLLALATVTIVRAYKPGCIEAGYACAGASECCGRMTCSSGGSCQCQEVLSKCYADSECCGTMKCTTFLQCCKSEPDATCTTHEECCGRYSQCSSRGTCGSVYDKEPPPPEPACTPAAYSCSASSECCGSMDCQGGICCQTRVGDACVLSIDCCGSMFCSNGGCVQPSSPSPTPTPSPSRKPMPHRWWLRSLALLAFADTPHDPERHILTD
jgi:hypothetical protein